MKNFLLLSLCAAFLWLTPAQAQAQDRYWRIELNGSGGTPFGDFASENASELNTGAGYSLFSAGGDMTVKYYFNRFAIGIKFLSAIYDREEDTYGPALNDAFPNATNAYYFTQGPGYVVIGTQLGVSYEIPAGEIFSIEPYIYGGWAGLATPIERFVYPDANTGNTTTYEAEEAVSDGGSLSAGAKFRWQFHPVIALDAYLEYFGAFLGETDIEGVIYDATDFQSVEISRPLEPQAINIGIGFSVALGKK